MTRARTALLSATFGAALVAVAVVGPHTTAAWASEAGLGLYCAATMHTMKKPSAVR